MVNMRKEIKFFGNGHAIYITKEEMKNYSLKHGDLVEIEIKVIKKNERKQMQKPVRS